MYKIRSKLQANEVNRNGMYFKPECLKKAFDEYFEKHGKKKTAIGNLGPLNMANNYECVVPLHEAAFLAEGFEIIKDEIYVDVVPLKTTNGELLKNLVEQMGEQSVTMEVRGLITPPTEEDGGMIKELNILSFGITPVENPKKGKG